MKKEITIFKHTTDLFGKSIVIFLVLFMRLVRPDSNIIITCARADLTIGQNVFVTIRNMIFCTQLLFISIYTYASYCYKIKIHIDKK